MKIEHKQNDNGGSFFIDEGQGRIAELTYRSEGKGRITIDHTEVDEKFRGEGVARDLVAGAVAFARENELRIVPTCPYARKVIEGTPEFRTVLA